MGKEFQIPVADYIANIMKLIQERLSSAVPEECVEIEFVNKSGSPIVSSVTLKITDEKFKNFESSEYVIRIAERVIPKTGKSIQTGKYSYEVRSTCNETDFVRFDYKPYDTFPHYHINSDEKTWGNHLTFPNSTNLNLEKLDCFKAINIFNAFVAHPDEHILDTYKNERYRQMIEKEGESFGKKYYS